MPYDDRYARMNELVKDRHLLANLPLLKGVDLGVATFDRLKASTNYFLWDCLSTWYGDKSPPFCDNMLTEYEDLVRGLPNKTPNGILLPKRDVYASYNVVHKIVSEILAEHGLPRFFKQMMPINVRIVDGSDRDIDMRPTSPTRPHVEMWVGFPSNALVCLFPIFGNTRNVDVKFYEPREFPPDYQRALETYEHGLPLLEGATQYDAHFDPGAMYLMDSFLIHHTHKTGPGLRLSVDFMCVYENPIASDANTTMTRTVDMLSPDEWVEIGRKRLWYAPMKLQGYVPQNTLYKHPAALELIKMER